MYNNIKNLTIKDNKIYYKDGITCVSSQGALFNQIFRNNAAVCNDLQTKIQNWNNTSIKIRKDKE